MGGAQIAELANLGAGCHRARRACRALDFHLVRLYYGEYPPIHLVAPSILVLYFCGEKKFWRSVRAICNAEKFERYEI